MYIDRTYVTNTHAPAVQGIRCVSIVMPAQADSVGALRLRASALFAAWAMNDDEQDTATLVISELLTNAVVHGRDEMTLTLTITGSELEITVSDHGKSKRSTVPSDPEEHGRGLSIVAVVTRDLSVHETATGWRARACMELAAAVSVADRVSETGTVEQRSGLARSRW